MRNGRRAAISGTAEWAPQRRWDTPMFGLEAYGKLAREALDDAGMELGEIDGILCTRLGDAPMFAPAAVAEYLGIEANFGEVVDLGGANATGMVWRGCATPACACCLLCRRRRSRGRSRGRRAGCWGRTRGGRRTGSSTRPTG